MLFVLFWFLAKSHFSSFYLASVFYSTFFDFGYRFFTFFCCLCSLFLLLLFASTFHLLNDKKFFFFTTKIFTCRITSKVFLSVFYSTFFGFLLLFIFTFSSLVIRVHLPPFLLNDKKFFFL
jgi:hypothetical protein